MLIFLYQSKFIADLMLADLKRLTPTLHVTMLQLGPVLLHILHRGSLRINAYSWVKQEPVDKRLRVLRGPGVNTVGFKT